jgi:hypothetical protein
MRAAKRKKEKKKKKKKKKKTRDALSKRREDLSFFPFKIAVFGVFFVGSTDLRFLQIALDLVCKSRSRSSLFNIRSDRLL